jgi:predicted metal-dependent HD superfamily phosphohydrolase
MNYRDIIEKAENFVRTFVKEHQNLNIVYHRLIHTENVVAAAIEIAHHYKLSERDRFICIVAAWFHDIGYYENALSHEQIGAKKAGEFLVSNGVDEETTIAIKHCILATRIPQSPTNLLEEIVCDADLYHFGTDDFLFQDKLMRKETEALHHLHIDKEEWHKGTILLLENHHYHTKYCTDLLNKKKKQNLEKLKKKTGEELAVINPIDALVHEYSANGHHVGERSSNNQTELPDRGAVTLFRIASGIGQRLNEQADTKAHILISVNSIIISVFIGIVLRKHEVHSYLTLAVIMFLIVNLLTIIFSILATRPSVPDSIFCTDDVAERKVNLLFFGNFYKMNFDDYSKGMFQVIGDRNYLYLTLIRNLYDQGVVLGQKYRLLKIAYNVFMFGIVVSIIAFFIASKR